MDDELSKPRPSLKRSPVMTHPPIIAAVPIPLPDVVPAIRHYSYYNWLVPPECITNSPFGILMVQSFTNDADATSLSRVCFILPKLGLEYGVQLPCEDAPALLHCRLPFVHFPIWIPITCAANIWHLGADENCVWPDLHSATFPIQFFLRLPRIMAPGASRECHIQ